MKILNHEVGTQELQGTQNSIMQSMKTWSTSTRIAEILMQIQDPTKA